MAGGPEILVRALTWNVAHGLDHPPDRNLATLRLRFFRATEVGATYARVNRVLRPEFSLALASYEWDVTLLQEAPPRWLQHLARATGARAATSALTARNFAAPLRARLADLNPVLMGVHEGGSNQLLVRPPWHIVETRRLTLTRRPERRRMLWARLRGPHGTTLAIANVHLTAHESPQAGREALLAAAQAVAWAGDDPLLFGGDLNAPDTCRELRARFGLTPEPEPETISHLSGREVEVVRAPVALPDAARDVPGPERRLIRLSDHPPVVAQFGVHRPRAREASPSRHSHASSSESSSGAVTDNT
jgi:endonuclease/exonuclease/phosphatase family metal-dependent hydrolase